MMDDRQFSALADLIQLREGKSKEAARIVLVHERSVKEAAEASGLSSSGVSKVLARCRHGIELANIVAGVKYE